jgi:hypothetical protein
MMFNYLEQVEAQGKDDKPFEIFLDNKSTLCMASVSFRDTPHSRHILRTWHYIRTGIQIAQVADTMTNILPIKGLLSKLIYALIKVDRD